MSYQPPSPQEDKATGGSGSGGGATTTAEEEKEQTLYEILRASPDATRSELKQQYVKLARVSHPDAQIGGNNNGDGKDVDFQEIAEAWRTLGDPKSRRRYDRQLKAKAWGDAAQRLTNERLEQVAPVASKLMDNLAVPFLRRTAFVGQAIATGVKAASAKPPSQPPSRASTSTSTSSTISKDANGAVDQAVEGQLEVEVVIGQNSTSAKSADGVEITVEAAFQTNASLTEIINRVTTDNSIPEPTNITGDTISIDDTTDAVTFDELSTKSLVELEEEVQLKEEKVKKLNEELDSVKEQRLFASLESTEHTLSSTEAEEVLEKLTGEGTVSFINRATKKTIIEKEISSLRNTEKQFTKKLESYAEIDREWNEWLSKQEDAKKVLVVQKQNELAARMALVNASKLVDKADQDVKEASNNLRGVEQEVRRSAQEMEKVSTTLSRKQERVRSALRRKTELMKGGITVQYITEEEVRVLLRKETQLMGESKQIATMVARLQSRADKLKKRAEALEELKNN